MGTAQTTSQTPKDILIGSVRFEYSTDNGSSFTNVGVGDAFAFTEEITPLDSAPDNGETPDILKGIASQTATITGNLWEYNLTKINALRGGVDTLSSVASSLVEDNDQVVASGDWSYNVPITLSGQNQDGTIPTINSIVGSTDTTPFVLLTDYTTLKQADGQWAVVILDSVSLTTESQSITIDTDYTPSASTSLSTGGLSDMTPVWIRLTNRVADVADATDAAANSGISLNDAIYRKTLYDFYYCTVNAGDSSSFVSKDETSPQVPYALSMMAKNKPGRTLGDQLKKVTKSIELQSAVTI